MATAPPRPQVGPGLRIGFATPRRVTSRTLLQDWPVSAHDRQRSGTPVSAVGWPGSDVVLMAKSVQSKPPLRGRTVAGCALLLLASVLLCFVFSALQDPRRGAGRWQRRRGSRPALYRTEPEAIVNGQQWTDTEGHLIQAHGGGIVYCEAEETYFWFGEDKGGRTQMPEPNSGGALARVEVIGISVYSSEDLVNWEYQGLALRGGAAQHPDLAPNRVVERPKVLYNSRTEEWVMWVHIDDARYEVARVGVATSRAPEGPYTYQGSFQPHGQQSRDFTVFQDDDGTGYIAYSSENNKAMHVGALTPDFRGVEQGYVRTLVGRYREAPSLFKHAGMYFLLTSGCTGWNSNRAEVFMSRRLRGGASEDWVSLGSPCVAGTPRAREHTFFSQASAVVAIPGRPGTFLFMADQWNENNLGASRYLWLPAFVPAAGRAWQARLPRRGGAGGVQVLVPWEREWRVGDWDALQRRALQAALTDLV